MATPPVQSGSYPASAWQAQYPNQPFQNDLSRQEKADQLWGQVLPTSLAFGLGTLEASALSAAEGAATGAAVGAGAATAGASLGAAAWGATIVGGLYGAINLATNWGRSTPAAGATSGVALGASIGTMIAPGIGTGIGAAIGALAGGLLGSVKTGKSRDQRVRDRVRAALLASNIIDSNYCVTLADGSKYDIGKDGKPRAELGGRRPFELDFSHPFAKYAVSWLNPLIESISGGNKKIQTDFVGYFANAAMSNAKSLDDVRRNVNAIFARFGVSDEALYRAITAAARSGQLDQGVANAYLNGLRERRDPAFVGDSETRETPLSPKAAPAP